MNGTSGADDPLFVRAIYGYDGSSTGSLSFQKGDIIEVITKLESGWWDGSLLPNEERGWFPSNYVAQISQAEADVTRDEAELSRAETAAARQAATARRTTNARPTPSLPASTSIGTLGRSESELESVLWNGFGGGAAAITALDEMTSTDMFAEIAAQAAHGESDDDARSSTSEAAPPVAPFAADGLRSTAPSDYWVPRVTDDGQIYYFNSRTGDMSRDQPPDLDDSGGQATVTARGHRTVLSEDSIGLPQTVSAASSGHSHEVPDGWVAREAGEGVFWENRFTGERRWQPPPGATDMARNGSLPDPTLGLNRISFSSSSDADSVLDAVPAARPRRTPTSNGEVSTPTADPSRSRQVTAVVDPTTAPAFDALTPPPGETLAALEARANDALYQLIDCAHPRSRRRRDEEDGMDADPEIERERERLGELMSTALSEVRALLHATDVLDTSAFTTTVARWPFAMTPAQAKALTARRPSTASSSVSASTASLHQAELRPYTRKLTSTMSKLALSVRAVWGMMATSAEEEREMERSWADIDSDGELEAVRAHRVDVVKSRHTNEAKLRWDIVDGAREVSEGISRFIEEIERLGREAGLPSPERSHLVGARRREGVVQTTPLALIVPGASVAGNWRGNGFVPSGPDADLHKAFSRETVALLNATRKALAEQSSELRAVLNTTIAKAAKRASVVSTASARSTSSRPSTPAGLVAPMMAPVQSAVRHQTKISSHLLPVLQALGAYLSAVDDVDIAARVDVDQDAARGSDADPYAQSIRAARSALGRLEPAKQTLYDAGPTLLVHFQAIGLYGVIDSLTPDAIAHLPDRAQPPGLSPLADFAVPPKPSDPIAAMLATLIAIDRAVAAVTETLDALMLIADEQAKEPHHRARPPSLTIVPDQLPPRPASSNTPTQPDSSVSATDSFGRTTTTTTNTTPRSKRESYGSQTSSAQTWDPQRRSMTESLGSRQSMAGYPMDSGAVPLLPSVHDRRETLESVGMRQTASDASSSTHDSPTTRSPSRPSKLERFFGAGPTAIPTARPGTASSSRTDEALPAFLGPDYDLADISYNMDAQIKGGALYALVARLTSHESVDHTYISNFLMTFRTFTSANGLLDLLFARYFLAPPPELTPDERELWTNRKLKIVQIRTVNVLKIWVETHLWESDADVVLPRVADFAERVGGTSAAQLTKVVDARRRNGMPRRMTGSLQPTVAPPASIVPKSRKLKFLDLDPLELARQLTLIDSRLCARITPAECLAKAWPKQIGSDTPNITNMANMGTTVSHWVSDTILRQDDIRKRASTIKHFVLVAECCRKLQNYSTLMSIIAGLESTPVHRLRRTWDTLNQRTLATKQALYDLMSPHRNFGAYRDAIRSIGPPCVPFIGVFLTSWTFIGDGNSDTLRDKPDQINMQKRSKAAELIQQIQLYQSTPYNLSDVPAIRALLDKSFAESDGKDDQTMFAMSLQLEPREREDEKIARLLSESGFL